MGSMNQYTIISNVGHVDMGSVRLWAHIVLIDNKPHDRQLGTRQIRGLSWGGLPSFTVWIDNDCEVRMENEAGGNLMLLTEDRGMIPLDSGCRLLATHSGEDVTLEVSADNHRNPELVIQQADDVPFGDAADALILPHRSGQMYPRAVWTEIPRQQ